MKKIFLLFLICFPFAFAIGNNTSSILKALSLLTGGKSKLSRREASPLISLRRNECYIFELVLSNATLRPVASFSGSSTAQK
jgi:hypothetical protein